MTQAAHPEDEDRWKGHGPRPVGPWPLARRVHQLSLLVAVALLWCLAATSLFMSNAKATAPAAPTATPTLVPFERPHPPEVLAGEPVADVVGDGALASPQDADDPEQPEPQWPQRSRSASGRRRSARNPRRDLRALQRLLRRSAGGLSDAQRAKYAATLHTALRRWLTNPNPSTRTFTLTPALALTLTLAPASTLTPTLSRRDHPGCRRAAPRPQETLLPPDYGGRWRRRGGTAPEARRQPQAGRAKHGAPASRARRTGRLARPTGRAIAAPWTTPWPWPLRPRAVESTPR